MSDLTLWRGDCLELMGKIPDKSIDMILCDLPYGKTNCDWDKIIPFSYLWQQYERIIKENGAILLFGIEPFSSMLRLSNEKMYKYDIYWQKEKLTNVFLVNKQFGSVIENISVFYKKQPTYNPQMRKREKVTNPKPMKGNLNVDETKVITGVYKHSKNYNPNLVYPINILKFNRDSKKGNKALHLTQKPVALLEYLIKTYTNEGELVLDNCAGSMSTAIACLNINRNFIGIEKNEEYYDIGCNRIIKHIEENKINVRYL